MRKDIEFPEVKDIHIAALKEWDEAFLNQSWNIYLINSSQLTMEVTIVVSRGSKGDRKTATLRHGLGIIEPKTFRKVEFIAEEVLPFKNEFLLTFSCFPQWVTLEIFIDYLDKLGLKFIHF